MSTLPSGAYIPGNSILHRLDARVKLMSLFLLLAAILSSASLWSYGFILCIIGVVSSLSQLPPRYILGSIRRLWLFFILILLMNALFFDSTAPLWSWGIFTLSLEGLQQGGRIVFNVILIMLLGNILMCTTAPMEITQAVAALLKPLKWIGVPVDDVALIISAALQFIPTLIEETEMIKKAQTARGARFESRRLTERAASYLPLILPIFLAAFRRADDLATAMEARGYRSASNRTQKEAAPLGPLDILALASCTATCAVQICVL